MAERWYFFAGGGTGGHIYPNLAVAEKLIALQPEARVHFFCSDRPLDRAILEKTGLDYTALPAKGFAARPDRLAAFLVSMYRSFRRARGVIGERIPAVLLATGGFASAPAAYAAHKLAAPIVLMNLDAVPGKANKFIARLAREIFVQFEGTAEHFGPVRDRVSFAGCPLRTGFANPDKGRAVSELRLDPDRNTLLIAGGSSGARNINRVLCLLLERLSNFAQTWQIVHLTGAADYNTVRQKYDNLPVSARVLEYYDDMPSLLALSELVVARSGAVSVAEYAAAAVPAVCIPYPYHRDRQQQLNAEYLVRAGCAVMVEDTTDPEKTAENLWPHLHELLTDERKRTEMATACGKFAKLDAAEKIADHLLGL